MIGQRTDVRQRLAVGIAAALIHLAAFLGLIAAFAGGLAVRRPGDAALLSIFTAEPRSKPPPPAPPQTRQGGAPLPAARRAAAAPVQAIAPNVKPSPRPAALIPASGNAPASGATPAGSGSGGDGSGAGSGSGEGNGEGADGGSDLRLISGGIYEDDYPRDAVRLHQSGRVHIRFLVGADGRVSSCTVTRSSGSPSLDNTTCRLILRRFRYEPSRDAAGRPHADVVEGVHHWRMGGGIDMEDREGDALASAPGK